MGTKNKNMKNSLGAKWNASHLAMQLCALRHWKRVSMPPTTQSLRHPLTRAHHIAPRIQTALRSRRKTPDDKMISKGGSIKSPKTILHGRDAILRVRVKWLIFNIVSRLWATGFGFSPKTSGFCPFVDATDLDRCEALASAKGCFLCFCFWFHPVIFYWTGKIGEKRWVSVQ